MKEILKKMTLEEYLKASKTHLDFHSAHEAFSVTLEELEEMQEEAERVHALMRQLWGAVKKDNLLEIDRLLFLIKEKTELLLSEGVQFSAMILKFQENIINGKSAKDGQH